MSTRILQVLPDLKKNGGVERGVLDWVQQHPDILWVASAGGPLASNVQHHVVLPLDSKNPWQMALNATKLAQLITENNIHLVHVRSRAPAWSVMWACHKTGVPWLSTYHGLYNAHNFAKKYYNSIMTRGQTVIAISDWVAQHIQNRYPAAHISIIHEGINTDHFCPAHDTNWRISWRNQHKIRDDQKVILLPGRLTRWKGQHILLEAARRLDNSWIIALLGDTQQQNYADELKKTASTLPVKVLMLPSCPDMRAPYAGADVVVSCSTDPEAFGRITAEALAMERPYIGTNHGGSIELTNNGQFGQLVPPGDAQALWRALLNAKPTTGAHNYIHKNYDIKKMHKKTMDLYDELISPPCNKAQQ